MELDDDSFDFSIDTYFTTQVRQIINMGPLHSLTWATNRDHLPLQYFVHHSWETNWLQVSVHSGTTCQIMIQFVLPHDSPDTLHASLNAIFKQYGWTNRQADGREALVYYIGRAKTARELLKYAEEIGTKCSEVVETLWQIQNPNEIALLGARGPRTHLKHKADTPIRSQRPTTFRVTYSKPASQQSDNAAQEH